MRRMVRFAVPFALLACRPQPRPTAVARPEQAPVVAVNDAPALPAPASPPSDSDGDGVPDARDRCPDEPEDLDQFEDDDGCVDRDNDRDRVLDAHEFVDGRWTNCDRMSVNGEETDCRNRPEDYDGYDDEDGCPDVLCLDVCAPPVPGRMNLDRRGEPVEDPAKVLDAVVAYMQAHPTHLVVVGVRVVKRRTGDPAAWRLSARVAERWVDELARLGVARERLEAVGWGNYWRSGRSPLGDSVEMSATFTVKLGECCRYMTLERPVVESGCR